MTLTQRLMTRPILVALCAAGAWTSGELVTAHAGPWPSVSRGKGTHRRICGTGQDGASQCAAVLNSDWSAFDFDVPVLSSNLTLAQTRLVVPVAFLGLAYFIFLGTWCAFVGPPATWGRRWAWIPGLALAGGVARICLDHVLRVGVGLPVVPRGACHQRLVAGRHDMRVAAQHVCESTGRFDT